MAAEMPGDAQIHIGTKIKYEIRREQPLILGIIPHANSLVKSVWCSFTM